MQVLLDECLPRRLKFELKNHNVKTGPEMGWAGKSNGELLALAKGKFDVFITIDQNLVFQQNVKMLKIAIIVLVSKSNRLEALKTLMPKRHSQRYNLATWFLLVYKRLNVVIDIN